LSSLEALLEKGGFDALIIETTGLANPAPIAQTFMLDDDLNDELVLDAVVCVVDGAHIKATGNAIRKSSSSLPSLTSCY
jgi:G3E family GTPase